ncbi:dipeptidase [Alkalicoccus urumqiensis]|uniref:Diguanylate cyclase n=1 Tax=Alkalicoccus urumqiensis TaxID=1548213 RepID=A0A2P6MKU2_ALKUR|nr:membrane dipeptidase [Alkalicoccus urumqiensis]PRO66883.1 diguanylate cyclase [Alkalicoccus urumqiensis]
MTAPVYDLHCDVLLKLAEEKGADFEKGIQLDAGLPQLKRGGARLQFFAVFLEPDVPPEKTFSEAVRQVDLFHEVVARTPGMVFIDDWRKLAQLKEGDIGCVLTLEGAEPIHHDLSRMSYFYDRGVRSLGLTWNQANLTADGIGETRGAGLTSFGKEVVQWNTERGVLTDVSHLSVQGVYDVLSLDAYALATHSNAKSVCGHRRNLSDDQLKMLFEKKGLCGLVYNPPFVIDGADANLDDLLAHTEHMLELGGENCIALGSDFDGIEEKVEGLSDASGHRVLQERLKSVFGVDITEKISWKNAHEFLLRAGK